MVRRSILLLLTALCLAGCTDARAPAPETYEGQHFEQVATLLGSGTRTFRFELVATGLEDALPSYYGRIFHEEAAATEGRGLARSSLFFVATDSTPERTDRVAIASASVSRNQRQSEEISAGVAGAPVLPPFAISEGPEARTSAFASSSGSGGGWVTNHTMVWAVAYNVPPDERPIPLHLQFNTTRGYRLVPTGDSASSFEKAAGRIALSDMGGSVADANVGHYESAWSIDGAKAHVSTVGNTLLSWLLVKNSEGEVRLTWSNHEGFVRTLSVTDRTTTARWAWSYHSCAGEEWDFEVSGSGRGYMRFDLGFASLPVAEDRHMGPDPQDPDPNACSGTSDHFSERLGSTVPGLVA